VSPLEAIRVSLTLREAALRAIRAGIVTGEIASNGIYSAPALAAQLGVSATPVREAMLDLVAQGLVEPVRNRGFRILPVGETDLDEIHELRLLIEVPVSRELAGKVPKAALERFRRFAADSVSAAVSGDLVGYLSADRDFHLGLLELHGNRRLVDFISQLRDQARLYGLGDLVAADSLAAYAQEHDAIIDSLEAGDAGEVERRMRRHLQHTRGSWAGRAEPGSAR
jgi:DNA-binding GntR family transcriptional regulator